MTRPGDAAPANFSRFLQFGLVGIVGFLVDGGILQALVSPAGWGPVAARAISFPVAVVATWLLNRHVTFRESRRTPVLRSLGRYLGVSLAGASVNLVVYTSLVVASSAMAAQPLVPLAIASIAALTVNYIGSKHFAFR